MLITRQFQLVLLHKGGLFQQRNRSVIKTVVIPDQTLKSTSQPISTATALREISRYFKQTFQTVTEL